MCWICKGRNYTGTQVAKEDIPIFKIVNRFNAGYISEIYKYKYALDEPNPVEDLIIKPELDIPGWPNCTIYMVERGYHSYALKNLKVLSKNRIAYNDRHTTIVNDFQVVVKGIIPKGSLYLVNDNNTYVSNQIILQKEINIARIARKNCRNQVIKFFKNIFKLTK